MVDKVFWLITHSFVLVILTLMFMIFSSFYVNTLNECILVTALALTVSVMLAWEYRDSDVLKNFIEKY